MYVINPRKAKILLEVYDMLKVFNIDKDRVEVEYEKFEYGMSSCVVRIVGTEIIFNNGRYLAKLSQCANHFNIVRNKDGEVMVIMRIYGIALPYKEKR